MEVSDILITIGGGLIAGIINTLAGNGSAITLTILTELLGLPGNLANGTNRVGILSQSIASIIVFQRNKMIQWSKGLEAIFLCFIGAIAGVILATNSSDEQFMSVFKYLLLVLFIFLLIKPKRWLNPETIAFDLPLWARVPILLGLGFYGGFIQMGMGIFLLAFLVLGYKMRIMHANAIKMVVVGIYTVFVFGIFFWRGWIVWEYGLLLAIGQIIGGWLTAHYFSRWKGADKFAYYTLVVIIVFALIRLFF